MCSDGRPDEGAEGVRYASGAFGDAYLKRSGPAAGYSTVLFRGRHVADPTDLTAEETTGFWQVIAQAARAIQAVFGPCHINYQLLGNAVPHVHAHVIPRYLDDPDPERPLRPEVWAAPTSISDIEFAQQVEGLRRAASES